MLSISQQFLPSWVWEGHAKHCQGLLSYSFLTLFLLLTPLSPKCSTNELPPVSTSAVRTTTSKQTLKRTDKRDSCVGVARCVIKQEQKDGFWEISEKFLRLLAANELEEDGSRRKTREWSWLKDIGGLKWRNISRAENQERKYWSSITPTPPPHSAKAQTFSFPPTERTFSIHQKLELLTDFQPIFPVVKLRLRLSIIKMKKNYILQSFLNH